MEASPWSPLAAAQRARSPFVRAPKLLSTFATAMMVLGVLAAAWGCCAGFARGLPSWRTTVARGHSLTTLSAAHGVERRPSGGKGLANEWRLNVGHAIDVLRTDVVALFDSATHEPDMSIFAENIQAVDARMPNFQLNGLAAYKRFLAALQWSVAAMCERSDMKITAVSPVVHNEVYMRWRLHVYPKDMLASATGFLHPYGGFGRGLGFGTPIIVEGYSRYEFHPWSGEIVRHTLDITNPPLSVMDIFQRYAQAPTWLTPIAGGVGVPQGIPR